MTNHELEVESNKGNMHTAFVLGERYYDADDTDKAKKWFIKAVEQCHPEAAINLFEIYYRSGLQLPRGQKKQQNDLNAFLLTKIAADQGHPIARMNLGQFYISGYGTSKNIAEGIKTWDALANEEDQSRKYEIAINYFEHKMWDKSIEWARRSADEGFVIAHHLLARFYHDGLGVEKNMSQAYSVLTKAFDQCYTMNSDMQNEVNSDYVQAIKHFNDQEYEQSFKMAKVAEGEGFVIANHLLARLYHDGLGVEENIIQAYAHLNKGFIQCVGIKEEVE